MNCTREDDQNNPEGLRIYLYRFVNNFIQFVKQGILAIRSMRSVNLQARNVMSFWTLFNFSKRSTRSTMASIRSRGMTWLARLTHFCATSSNSIGFSEQPFAKSTIDLNLFPFFRITSTLFANRSG